MKTTIVGCTFIICASIIYALRLVAGAILVVRDSIKGGNAGINNGLEWLGSTPFVVTVLLFIIGLILIFFGIKEHNDKR